MQNNKIKLLLKVSNKMIQQQIDNEILVNNAHIRSLWMVCKQLMRGTKWEVWTVRKENNRLAI